MLLGGKQTDTVFGKSVLFFTVFKNKGKNVGTVFGGTRYSRPAFGGFPIIIIMPWLISNIVYTSSNYVLTPLYFCCIYEQ